MEDFEDKAQYYKVFINSSLLVKDGLIKKSFENKKGFYHEIEAKEDKEIIHKGILGIFNKTSIKKGYVPIIVKKEGNIIRDILTNEEYEEVTIEGEDDKLKVFLVVPISFEEVCEVIGKLGKEDIDRYINIMEEIVKSNKESINSKHIKKLAI